MKNLKLKLNYRENWKRYLKKKCKNVIYLNFSFSFYSYSLTILTILII